MAADSGAQGGNARSVESKFDSYLSAQSSLKMVRLVMLLVFVIVALASVYRMIAPGVDLATDKEKQELIVNALQKDLEQRIVPELTKQGREMVEKDLVPYFQAEFESRMKTQVPEIERLLQTEVENLLRDLEENLQALLANRSEEFGKRIIERFTQEFPELADENRANTIMANMEVAANRAGGRVLETYLSEHASAIEGIAMTMDSIRVPEDIQRMNNDQLFEYAMSLLVDLLATKFDIERELTMGGDTMGSINSTSADGRL